jgi:hypothetical protein
MTWLNASDGAKVISLANRWILKKDMSSTVVIPAGTAITLAKWQM